MCIWKLFLRHRKVRHSAYPFDLSVKKIAVKIILFCLKVFESFQNMNQRNSMTISDFQGLNRAICETDSFCAKKTLCTFNFSILRDQSDVILRLIDSSGRCGRLRVNPIGGWLTKWSITAVARRRGYRGGWAVGDEGVEDDDYDDEESKRGEVDGYDLTDECGVPSVFRSNQYQVSYRDGFDEAGIRHEVFRVYINMINFFVLVVITYRGGKCVDADMSPRKEQQVFMKRTN